MSSVYLATRDDGQFEQAVAVKLMSPHLASEFFTERFRRERQILADLEHPNTTRLIDGGVSQSGDPYLVMEYVDGLPLDQYCDGSQLGLPDRIRLLLRVSSALQYAHGRQVVHRDLKPGNILVNREGVPKLLDFGTAKLLSPELAESTTTRFGMMTPRYASPEQLCADNVSEASDIYSFGVILYETVTGEWPFGNPNSIIDGLERAAGKVKAAKASTVVTQAAAEARSSDKDELARQIKGDLDLVLAKALEWKPEKRYESMEQFAGDLQLFLNDKPTVTAVPAPWWNWRWMQAAVAIAVLGAAIAFVRTRQPTQEPTAQSIVVLPFVNADGDGRNQYLADGLTADFTDELDRRSTLHVIGQASAMRFAGRQPDLRTMGRQLNVSLAVTGELARTDTGMHLWAKLQRVPSGDTVWSRSYKVAGLNLTRVENEMVSSVAAALQAGKVEPGPLQPVNDQAYDLTQRAAHEMQSVSPAAYVSAERELRSAIQIDPQYARAIFLVGCLHWNRNVVRGNQVRTQSEVHEAVSDWNKALELMPNFSAARGLLAKYEMQYNWNWTLAESELKQAIAYAPDVNSETAYAFLLLFERRFAEAEMHRRRADELDPASAENLSNSGLFWFQAARFERSLEAFGKLKMPYAPAMIVLDYLAQGQVDEAAKNLQNCDPRNPTFPFVNAMLTAASGHKQEALAMIQKLEKEDQSLNVPQQWFALVYAQLGNVPNTVRWLNRAADAHEWQVLNIAVHPFFKNMQNDPGFRELERRMGLKHNGL